MVMDFLEMGLRGRAVRAYRAQARIRESPELIATLRWYQAPPGAKVFPGVHAFGSNVWERGDWDAPRSGLGFLDFNFSDTDRGLPPPGVTGQSTPTPLDWFLNGVPAGVVGPYPNGRCVPAGDPWVLRTWASGISFMPLGVIPAAGLQVMQYSLNACQNRWQVMLYGNQVALGPGTTIDQLQEVNFPGYKRQSPVFSTTQQQADNSSVTVSAPLTWTRGSGAGVQPVWGWALVDPISGALIAAGQLTNAPQIIANPGDSVFIQGFWLQLSPQQPTLATLAGSAGLGLGVVGAPVQSYFILVAGAGVDSNGKDWSNANGYWRLDFIGANTWRTPTFVSGGGQTTWWAFNTGGVFQAQLDLMALLGNPHGEWNAATYNGYSWISIPASLTSNIPGPAPFPVLLWPSQLEVDMPLVGSVVWDGGTGAVPPLHLLADGTAVSRTTYSVLFARYGTVFGVGDGSTTFNLPDLRGRLPRGTSPGGLGSDRPSAVALGATGGEETHTLTSAEMPSHNHALTDPGHTHPPNRAGGNFMDFGGAGLNVAGGGFAEGAPTTTGSATTGISLAATGGGGGHNTLPPNMGLRPLIFAGA